MYNDGYFETKSNMIPSASISKPFGSTHVHQQTKKNLTILAGSGAHTGPFKVTSKSNFYSTKVS